MKLIACKDHKTYDGTCVRCSVELEDGDRPMYVTRKIVAWRYWGTNYGHGYAAVLSCGHERMDLNDTRIGRPREAVCWYCKPEEQ